LPQKILVCLDGEQHTRSAIQWGIQLALALQAELTALHVIDPFLKKFYNELYSQGRKSYLDYVEDCLQAEGEQARQEFTAHCNAKGVDFIFKLRNGEPLQEILAELDQSPQDLFVTGGKQLNAWGRFRSRNLPARLQKCANTPILIVRGETSLIGPKPKKWN